MTACSNPGCDRRARCRGLCDTCYRRWRKHGDPQRVDKPGRKKQACCSICGRPVKALGLCKTHYAAYWEATRPWQVQCGDCGAELGQVPPDGDPWTLIDMHIRRGHRRTA